MIVKQEGVEFESVKYGSPGIGDFYLSNSDGCIMESEIVHPDGATGIRLIFKKRTRRVHNESTAIEWASLNKHTRVYYQGYVRDAQDHPYSAYELDGFYIINVDDDGVPSFTKLKGIEYDI